MTQPATVYNRLTAKRPLRLTDALDLLFFGDSDHYAKDSRLFLELLARIPKINNDFVGLAFWRNGTFVEAVRLDNGEFEAGNASPFASSEYYFIFERDGEDLTISVPRGNRDFSACHCINRFVADTSAEPGQNGYQVEEYFFELIDNHYVARIPGGRFRPSFLAVSKFVPVIREDEIEVLKD